MKAKKTIALLLALVLAAACFSGCGNDTATASDPGAGNNAAGSTANNNAAAANNNAGNAATTVTVDDNNHYTLTCANMTDPGSYGPYGSGGDRTPYNNVLYETLASVTRDGDVENIILKDYTDKGNGVYELTIYDYVHDTEGNPVTASDVVFSFGKAQENGSYATNLSALKEIKATGDYTLEMTLENERAGSFLGILCSINIITEAAWNNSSDQMVHDCVGTSPYRMTDYLEGSYVTFEKTGDYWQTDASLRSRKSVDNIDTIKWVIISDLSQAAASIESGDVDHAMVISAADYGLFMDNNGNAINGAVVDLMYNNLTYGITFNCGPDSLCSDINLRKAICTAIDNDAIAQNVFKGFGRAVGNYINPAYLDYDESLEHADSYYAYDEAAAKALLDASDYQGQTLKVLVSSNRNVRNAAVLFEAYLSAIGVNVELMQYEAATYKSYFYEDTGKEWDLALTMDQGVTGADYLWSVLFASDSSLYDFGSLEHIKDAKLQELYEKMAGKDTNSTASVREFLDYLEENCYQYGLMAGYKVNVGSSHVKSLSIDGITNIICGGCVVEPD